MSQPPVGPDPESQPQQSSQGSALMAVGPLLTPELRSKLEDLVGEAAEYAQASHATNTMRAYASDWRAFTAWCAGYGAPSCPAAPLTLMLYLTDASKELGVRTIGRRLAAITYYHREAGVESPAYDAGVQRVWRGIRRTKSRPPEKKSAAILERLRTMLPTEPTLRTLRDRAVLLIGWAGAFRRSELAALDVEDCRLEGPNHLVLTVRHSKTDQESAGTMKVILRGNHPETCPVRALDLWREAAAISTGALFRGVSRGGRVLVGRLTDRTIARIVQNAARVAGLDPTNYAGHSLRSGFITQAYLQDVPEPDIMEQSGHKSIAVAREYRHLHDIKHRDAAGRVGL